MSSEPKDTKGAHNMILNMLHYMYTFYIYYTYIKFIKRHELHPLPYIFAFEVEVSR